jgi:hypothetical protein
LDLILRTIPYKKVSRPKVKVPKPSGKGQYDDHFPSARWLADYRLDWLPSDAVADATAMQASAIDKRLGILAYGGQPSSAIRSRAKLKMIEKADAKEAPLRGGGASLRAGHGNVVPSDERREFLHDRARRYVRAPRQQVAIDQNKFAANTVFLRKFDKRG